MKPGEERAVERVVPDPFLSVQLVVFVDVQFKFAVLPEGTFEEFAFIEHCGAFEFAHT